MRVSVTAERAAAHVDLGAIERNCGRLRSLLGDGAALCAVVKADGYGHGAVESSRAALAGGASWLAVAASGEAADLRRAGIEAPGAGDGGAHRRRGPRGRRGRRGCGGLERALRR